MRWACMVLPLPLPGFKVTRWEFCCQQKGVVALLLRLPRARVYAKGCIMMGAVCSGMMDYMAPLISVALF